MARAFRGTSKKKSPGPDGIGPLAIACVYGWDPHRIEALIRAHIRLGIHPDRWKIPRGVTITKPGKDDCSLAKSYQRISLLNCLGKMVEKVAAMMVSDAMGVTIAQAQEAWGRDYIIGALLMDVTAAFPSVARGCLLRKMRRAGLDECLEKWTDSFMHDRKVIMSVDGQDGELVSVTTGLPRGLPFR